MNHLFLGPVLVKFIKCSQQLIRFAGINDNQRMVFLKKTVLSQKNQATNQLLFCFRKKKNPTCLRQIISVFFLCSSDSYGQGTNNIFIFFFLECWCLPRNMKKKKDIEVLCLKMNFWLLLPKSFLIPAPIRIPQQDLLPTLKTPG